ncbi:Asparagine synthetase (glutamine-hydrolyzing) [Prochlorococcus marinus str. MIT 9311]|nr:Asparagine synthetase (glutamine-hydrolyzing) [Prochlorococcus marinus str. MIT 9311]
MNETLMHRGPDHRDIWINEYSTVFLGHTRLSILDLSDNGNQPFHSKDGRFHLTFNGEIYNYKNLKDYLKTNGISNFKSNSDTEVLIELIALRGITNASKMLNGMFAFAVWDSLEKKIHLVRDRFGEKPLFYTLQKDTLYFGSEIKSILKIPTISKIINKEALSHYLRFNYIKNPLTIYKDIYKLEPGHILSIDQNITYKKYSYKNKNKKTIKLANQKEAEDLLQNQIIKSCLSRTISDVPIACFLSGGIDSSLVTSIIQRNSKQRIKTFTIGFDDQSIDESNYAEKIANFLGTDHTTINIEEKELLNNIDLQSEIYGEPFADQSSIATNILCKYASRDVKVCLSGDGGDEMFIGYDRYYKVNQLRLFLKAIKFYKKFKTIDRILEVLIHKIESNKNFSIKIDKIIKLISLLSDANDDNIYEKFNSLYRDQYFPLTPQNNQKHYIYKDLKNIQEMCEYDFETYLPDCILTKVDRASMHNSLEVRAPFLDHEIPEIIDSINPTYKKKLLNRKFILKKLLNKYLPKNIYERPKKGFSAPLNNWIKGPLKELTLDYLSIESLKKHNLLDIDIIERIKYEHYSGIRSWHNQIWNLLIFQQWYNKNF